IKFGLELADYWHNNPIETGYNNEWFGDLFQLMKSKDLVLKFHDRIDPQLVAEHDHKNQLGAEVAEIRRSQTLLLGVDTPVSAALTCRKVFSN
ncbi:MAG: hypothetical protein AAF203_03445, partial [Pseudomonadota bacterium]